MRMGFQAGVEYNGKIYFSEGVGFGLFSYDLSSGKVEFCTLFEEICCFALHRKAFLYKNEAWFIPQAGECITCVNLDTFELQRYEIPYKKKRKNPEVFLADGVIIDNKLVCVPRDVDTLIFINLDTHEFQFISDFIDPEEESILSVGSQKGNLIFYPYQGDYIRYLNPLTKECEKKLRSDKQYEYGDIAIIDEGFIFSPGTKNKLLFAGNTETKMQCDGVKDAYIGKCQVGDDIVFFPYESKCFLKVNTKNKNFEYLKTEEDVIKDEPQIFIQIDSKSGVYLASSLTGHILNINSEEKIKVFPVEADESDLKSQMIKKVSDDQWNKMFDCAKQTIICESFALSLNGFVKYLKKKEG